MLGLIVDAAVLMILLKNFSGEDVGFITALIVALVAALVTYGLAIGLAGPLGAGGIVVAALIGAAGVGIAVSALFGVEIKRSFLIGAIFIAVHIGIGIALQSMMHG